MYKTTRSVMRSLSSGLSRAVAFALLAGCSLSPEIPTGTFACTSTSECPSDFTCSAGFCEREGVEVDASMLQDMSQLDAGRDTGLDGGIEDGGTDDAGPTCTLACLNGGTCEFIESQQECACEPGFFGELCDQASDPCTPNPCEAHQVCVPSGPAYECRCPTALRGAACDDVDLNASRLYTDSVDDATGDAVVSADGTQVTLTEYHGGEGTALVLHGIDVRPPYEVHFEYEAAAGAEIPGDALGMHFGFPEDSYYDGRGAQLADNVGLSHLAGALNAASGYSVVLDIYTPRSVLLRGPYGQGLGAESVALPMPTSTTIEAWHDVTVTVTDSSVRVDVPDASFAHTFTEDLDIQHPTLAFGGGTGDGDARLQIRNVRLVRLDGDECDPNPCLNGGTCTDGDRTFGCACPDGSTGLRCQLDTIDECVAETDSCSLDATCANAIGGAECSCNAGFIGDGETCVDDPCVTTSCLGGSMCTSRIDGGDPVAECVCPEGTCGDGTTCAPLSLNTGCVAGAAVSMAGDPIAFYDFGTGYVDLSGNGHHITPLAGSAIVEDPLAANGRAANKGHLWIPTLGPIVQGLLAGQQDFSVALRLQRQQAAAREFWLFGLGGDGESLETNYFRVSALTNAAGNRTTFERLVETGAGTNHFDNVPSTEHIELGAYTDVVFVRAAGVDTVYVDGVGAELSLDGETPPTSTSNVFMLGGRGNEALDGLIDRAGVWDRALTTNEIAAFSSLHPTRAGMPGFACDAGACDASATCIHGLCDVDQCSGGGGCLAGASCADLRAKAACACPLGEVGDGTSTCDTLCSRSAGQACNSSGNPITLPEPLAHWNFDSGFADVSGNGYHLDPGRGARVRPESGARGRVLEAVAGRGYGVSTALGPMVNAQANLTMSLRVKAPNSLALEGYLMGIMCRGESTDTNIRALIWDNNAIRHVAERGLGLDNLDTSFDWVIDDQWHDYTVVQNGTQVSIYIDGSVVIDESVAGVPESSCPYFAVGSHPFDNDTDEVVLIDEAIVFGTALSAAQVAALPSLAPQCEAGAQGCACNYDGMCPLSGTCDPSGVCR